MGYNKNMLFDKVYVINMDKRTDRLEKISQELAGLGIAFERFPSVYDKDPISSCRKSHLGVISKAKVEGLNSVLILEDDAMFLDNFNENLESVSKELPENWDMLYLGAQVISRELFSPRLSRSIDSRSLQAYIVKSSIYDRLINITWQGHVDYGFSILHPEINAYVCTPALVKAHPGYSDLRQAEVDDLHIFK